MKSKRIDRVVAGVGRLALAAGTDHAPTVRRINAAITGLQRIGRLDVLVGLRELRYTPLMLLHHYERGQLDKLPTAVTSAPLVDAFTAFSTSHPASTQYRADLRTSARRLAKEAPKRATVADLPVVLRSLKQPMQATPVAFNKFRAHCLAFATEVAGKYGPLWTAVAGVARYKRASVPVTIRRRPLTVLELDQVCATFNDWPVYGGRRGEANKGKEKTVKRTIYATELAAMVRTLATTGMRPKEYWQREANRWTDRGSYVWVTGTKTAAAQRPTFRVAPPVLPACGEQFFRARFAAATEKALGESLDVYSLRRTFAAWCESARVEESRWKAYLGHGPQTVSAIYLQTKVLPFIGQDAATLTAWMTTERQRETPALRLERNA